MNLTPGGNQYVVHVINFPGGVHAAVAITGDDIYHVFINDALSVHQRRRALDHEIRHIDQNHLYNDILPIGYMEKIARGESPQEWSSTVDLRDTVRTIPCFTSLEVFRDFAVQQNRLRKLSYRIVTYEGGPDAKD